MHRAVQHLRGIGCQASGIISDGDLLEAVRAETRAHDYDQVILATSRQGAPGRLGCCAGTRCTGCGDGVSNR